MRIPARWRAVTGVVALGGLTAAGLGLARTGDDTAPPVDEIELRSTDTLDRLDDLRTRLRETPADGRTSGAEVVTPRVVADDSPGDTAPPASASADSPQPPAPAPAPAGSADSPAEPAPAPAAPDSPVGPDSPASVASAGSADS